MMSMRKGPPPKYLVTFRGKTQTVAEWAAELGMSKYALHNRIVCLGWDPERALTERVLTKSEAGRKVSQFWADAAAARRGDTEPLTGEEMWEGANTLPWADDKTARRVVDELGCMTLAQIGACLGLSREGVRQTMLRALAKLEAVDAKTGRVLREIAEGMSDDDGEMTYPDWSA